MYDDGDSNDDDDDANARKIARGASAQVARPLFTP